jgi:hypothetical protein
MEVNMLITNCGICGGEIRRYGNHRPGKFCSKACAGQARRNSKPVDRDWLVQKYLVEGLSTGQIAKLVHRHQKRVYEWLIGYGIPTRAKWTANARKKGLHWSKEWLDTEYGKGRTILEMAKDAGVCMATLRTRMVNFGIVLRSCAESVLLRGTRNNVSGQQHGMYGRRGANHPAWKGGHTPERQTFYQTPEWADAVKAVWARDDGRCQRCGTRKTCAAQSFHIHHIVSFSVIELRAVVSNLVLLCKDCHDWTHSNANQDKEFLLERPKSGGST